MGGATLRGSHEKKKGSKKGESMFADIKNDAIAAVVSAHLCPSARPC